MRPGEVTLEHASRSFLLRPEERARTLKELFVRRGRRDGARVAALDDVTLHIEPGEAVGLVGRNGAGKTSTLRCLAGIVPLDSGRAQCGGRVVSLLELGAGFGADFTGRENVFLNGALHGFEKEEIEERLEDIVAFSELGEFVDVPVRAYSAGMYLRLGFSIAAFLDVDVLLIDEVLAVGDESFQRKCLRRIAERMEEGATLILVSHDPSAIERVCRRVVVLDAGSVRFDDTTAEGLLFYHRLLGARPDDARRERRGPGVDVLDLQLRDSEDRARSAFRSGETVRVALSVTGPAERAVVAIEIRDSDGSRLFRTDTTLGAIEGETEVVYEIPRLGLLGGDYDLVVGAGDHDAPPAGTLDRIVRLSVSETFDAEGLVDLRGEWRVREREPLR
ncbi:MAG: ABC transporter ATP-binding protein [Thermoleophilaceae bacterium]|nr:ABC transporter ATP-binding protein [Thermoleophilaceae bacterium]